MLPTWPLQTINFVFNSLFKHEIISPCKCELRTAPRLSPVTSSPFQYFPKLMKLFKNKMIVASFSSVCRMHKGSQRQFASVDAPQLRSCLCLVLAVVQPKAHLFSCFDVHSLNSSHFVSMIVFVPDNSVSSNAPACLRLTATVRSE